MYNFILGRTPSAQVEPFTECVNRMRPCRDFGSTFNLSPWYGFTAKQINILVKQIDVDCQLQLQLQRPHIYEYVHRYVPILFKLFKNEYGTHII